MTNILELNGVSKSFPCFKLSNINLSLPKGYIMGLVGPNGAGKTTTIQLILNMLEKDKGEIFVFAVGFPLFGQLMKQSSFSSVVMNVVTYFQSNILILILSGIGVGLIFISLSTIISLALTKKKRI